MTRVKLYSIIILGILAIVLLASINANPDSPVFGVKRLQEKLFLGLQLSTEQKVDYYYALLSKRLKELEYLTNNKKTYLLWQSSLRYSATAGEVTDLITSNNLKVQASKFIDIFKKQHQAINYLLTNYPGDLDPTEKNWKFLEDAKNYLDLYIEKLSQVK